MWAAAQAGQFGVAAPAAIIMAWGLDWGLPSLIAGLMLGVCVQAASYVFILIRVISWPRMAARVAAAHKAEAAEKGGAGSNEPPDSARILASEA